MAHRRALLLAIVAAAIGACTSTYGEAVDEGIPIPDRDASSEDGRADATLDATDAGADASGTRDADVDDARDEDDIVDASKDAGICSGRPNGFAYKAGDPQARCCGGEPARLDSAANCGGCGIKCGAGLACGELVPGHYACKCNNSNAACVGYGYGSLATCYAGGGSFCNCQCPIGAATCAGQCAGGAICHVVSGNNYCAY